MVRILCSWTCAFTFRSFLSIFPELIWFIKWVIGYTTVLLLVGLPLILKQFFLVVLLNFQCSLTKMLRSTKTWSLPYRASVGPPLEWRLPINDPFLVLSVSQSLSHSLYALLILPTANLKSGFQSCALRNMHSPPCLYSLKGLAVFTQSQYSCVLSHSDDIHTDEAGLYLHSHPFIMCKLWHCCLQ